MINKNINNLLAKKYFLCHNKTVILKRSDMTSINKIKK